MDVYFRVTTRKPLLRYVFAFLTLLQAIDARNVAGPTRVRVPCSATSTHHTRSLPTCRCSALCGFVTMVFEPVSVLSYRISAFLVTEGFLVT